MEFSSVIFRLEPQRGRRLVSPALHVEYQPSVVKGRTVTENEIQA